MFVDPSEPPARSRWLRGLLFVGSAALAATALRAAWFSPAIGIGILAAIGALLIGRWWRRRRLRALLKSGDVDRVLKQWQSSLTDVPYARTMVPLLKATAFASYGWVEAARAMLGQAERGPVWTAAIEQRLFLDTLLLTFEGDRDGAMESAQRLVGLPLPPSTSVAMRVAKLRAAIAALARAFAHEAQPGDGQLLIEASEQSPLVHWAMRYAAAVVAIDDGNRALARTLIAEAPPWPAKSTFRSFHDEIAAYAEGS